MQTGYDRTVGSTNLAAHYHRDQHAGEGEAEVRSLLPRPNRSHGEITRRRHRRSVEGAAHGESRCGCVSLSQTAESHNA
jgi:hypothetical protein